MAEEATDIERARKPKSKQPRFTLSEEQSQATLIWLRLLRTWTKDAIKQIPEYQPDSRRLDKWLSELWRTEPLLSGVVSTVVGIDKNRSWNLTGGRNQVARFARVLRSVDNGAGWRRFLSMQSESFWTTNIGAVTEIGRLGKYGPMAALYHVDPTRCRLTGNPRQPLEYYPVRGKSQKWGALDFMRSASMPNIREEFNGLGYCAVMRAVQLTVLMIAIYRHDREMLFSMMPKGLLLMSGIDEVDWEDAMRVNQAQLTAREREFFAGLSVFFSGTAGEIDAKLISLSKLPENFSMSEWTNMLMYGYALVFGYDPREFWPVSGGVLGTGRETEIQAMKATGKGGLDFVLAFQDNLQRELPDTILFEFEQRDTFGEEAEYASMKAFADAVNAMASPAGPGMAETLTPEQRRILYAERGYIPDEWTAEEEEVTLTDVESVERDRLLSNPQVLRACQRFPEEQIVRLTWNWKSGFRTKVLWQSGEEALIPPRFYSLPTKAETRRAIDDIDPETVYYASEDVTITGEDVRRALEKWNQRHDAEWAGLPDADSVESEQGESE